ncbi:hypothetical protein [Burkholderia sp. Tr-20390]|uniref:hypothetical protein n=1 Tax=Burkholderia sp. Tr-20390 TaxID=2703904 RepID=UPI00197DC628|nr:hypothetical protein [Burkholderia sp. Tr-20390]MBN3729502.1 hypothetical protein [Burkholderia sp. Tr-20390]
MKKDQVAAFALGGGIVGGCMAAGVAGITAVTLAFLLVAIVGGGALYYFNLKPAKDA